MADEDSEDEYPYRDYVWCLHCERVARTTEWVANDWCCPFEGCNGNRVDAWSWESLQSQKPELPVTPVIGATYPLYD